MTLRSLLLRTKPAPTLAHAFSARVERGLVARKVRTPDHVVIDFYTVE